MLEQWGQVSSMVALMILEFAGFYMEQEESWCGVSSHYLLCVMCFPDTVALQRLLCNYTTMKTDFSKERIIYLERSSWSCGFH